MMSEGNSQPVKKLNRELRSIRRDLERLINELKNTEDLTSECFCDKIVEFEDLTKRFKETQVSLLRSLSIDTAGEDAINALEDYKYILLIHR